MKNSSVIALFIVFLYPVISNTGPWVHVDGEFQTQGPIRVFNGINIDNNKFDEAPITKTTENVTLYVTSTGNDNNDCLSSANACATPQEAINRIPKLILHAITINIGAGTFGPMDISGFQVAQVGSFAITGTLGNPTLTTGTVSGTATGGSTTQCVDGGQGWTVNELRGMLVLVSGQYRVVRDNDATTINLAGAYSATCSGKAYEILEQKTVIGGTSLLGYGPISITNNYNYSSDPAITNIKIASGTVGLVALTGTIGRIERLHVSGTTYGFLIQDTEGTFTLQDSYSGGNTIGILIARHHGSIQAATVQRLFAYNNSDRGIYLDGLGYSNFLEQLYSDSNTNEGVYLQYSGFVSFDTSFNARNNGKAGLLAWTTSSVDFAAVQVTGNGVNGMTFYSCDFIDIDSGSVSTNTGYGIQVDENSASNRSSGSFLNMVGTITVQTNSAGGIIAKNRSSVALTDVDGSNTGYGLELEVGSYATITSATGLTGTTNDATINDGTTALVWATHFNDNGDIAINQDNGCMIERRD